MPFSALDTHAIARALAQIADTGDDIAEVFFERLETVTRPPDDEMPGVRWRLEGGFAVRLLRRGLTWLASRDGFAAGEFEGALRQVARALPSAAYPEAHLNVAPFEAAPEAPEVLHFPGAVSRRIHRHHIAFPMRIAVRRHRRWTRVIGTRLAAEPQAELFYSCRIETPFAAHGTLLSDLGETAVEEVADAITELFRARSAAPPASGRRSLVLAPAVTAVLLHEAVAHALETDTLALEGAPEAATGHQVGSALLNVLDDPAAGPEVVRRTVDDEGVPVTRRWLLREGKVKEPIADLFAARSSARLTPGCGRRGSRHLPPVPRSTHLELLAGDASREELLVAADGGLYVPHVSRGALDPVSGEFTLFLPFARTISSGEVADYTGRCRLRGRISTLLAAVAGVGRAARPAGAGWCAKSGQRVPVWATAPPLLLEDVEVEA